MYLNDRHIVVCKDIVVQLVRYHHDSIWIMHCKYQWEIPLCTAAVAGNIMTEFLLINDGNVRIQARIRTQSGE